VADQSFSSFVAQDQSEAAAAPPRQAFGDWLKAGAATPTTSGVTAGGHSYTAPKISDTLGDPNAINAQTWQAARVAAKAMTDPARFAPGPSLADRVRTIAGQAGQVATTHAVKALGGSTMTELWDMAGQSAKSLVEHVTGENWEATRATLPAPAKTAEFLFHASKIIPGIVDFLFTPLGAATGPAAELGGPAAQAAIGAAFGTQMAGATKDAYKNYKKTPSASSAGDLVASAAGTLLPAVHAAGTEYQNQVRAAYIERARGPAQEYTSTGEPIRRAGSENTHEESTRTTGAQEQPQTVAGPQGQPHRGAEPGGGSQGPANGAAGAAAPEVANDNRSGGSVGQPPGGTGGDRGPGGAQPPVPEGNEHGPVFGLPGPGNGGTAGAQPGADSGSDGGNLRRVTGSADLPLTPDGKANAAKRNVPADVQVFHAPNQRSEGTARGASAGARPASWLAPWKLGEHEGKPVEEAQPAIDELMRNPGRAPGVSAHSGEQGESFGAASRRLIDGANAQYRGIGPNDKVLNITSGRALQIIDANGDPERIIGRRKEFQRGQIYRRTAEGLTPADRIVPGTQNFTTHEDTAWNPSKKAGGPAVPAEGPNGPIWQEYSGKPAEAIAKLQQEQRGEVPRVWRNEDLARATNTDGWIGLIWGDLKGGLAHIVDKHVIRQKDLKLEDLAEMIPRMRVAENDGRSVVLESDTHRATVRLSYDDVEKRWLVTAFEKRPSTGESPTGPGSPNRGGGPVIAPPNGPSVPPAPEGSGGAPGSSVAPGGGAVKRVDPLLGTHVDPSAVRQFFGDETGTSLVGSILKADAKEALALKAKRDAALAEVEKAKGTPGEQKFGQKTIHYFTGERDLWGARVNQVIARLRTLVPEHVEQEAISLMRDFKGREQELTQFLAGTHPAFQDLDSKQPLMRGLAGSETATARERIEQLRPAILRALDPTPRMREADAVLSKIAAGTLAEGQRLGILESRWTPEQYNPHILHPKGEGEVPTAPAGDRVGRAIGGKMSRYFAFAETRQFPTLLDAVVNNYRPKTLNAFDAFTIHGDKFATARATHILTGLLSNEGAGKWGVKENAPEGWVPLAAHSTEFRNLVGYADPEGLPAAAEQRLFVPQFISDALRPITDPDYMGRVPLFRAMRMTQAYQKAVQLGLSFFHAYTENLMALANMGPTGWVKALRANRESPEFLLAERDMIAHGGTSAIQGHTFDAYRALEPGSIPTWSDIWRRAPVLHQADALAGKITDFTFGNLQRRFKVTDYQVHLVGWLAKHPEASAMETSAAKQSMAKEVNAVYGGLNWENLGVNRATTEIVRALMLAPDWTFSNVFNVKYAAERGTPAGRMARMFWIRTIAGGLAATQGLSLMLSGKPSKNLTQVYFGTDADGEDVYQNVFFKGAGGDAVNLVHNMLDYGGVQGLARSLVGKAAPLLRAGLQVVHNQDFLGRTIVPKGMNPVAGTVRAALKTGEALAPVPFTVENLYNMLLGPDAGKYSVPEFLTTTVAGNPPRHVAPEGYRETSRGLVPENAPENQSIWDEIQTGKR
jgi:broad specificity phosphatase PhoE